jgi:hypothetical protein
MDCWNYKDIWWVKELLTRLPHARIQAAGVNSCDKKHPAFWSRGRRDKTIGSPALGEAAIVSRFY